jgi:hypothetical protein
MHQRLEIGIRRTPTECATHRIGCRVYREQEHTLRCPAWIQRKHSLCPGGIYGIGGKGKMLAGRVADHTLCSTC